MQAGDTTSDLTAGLRKILSERQFAKFTALLTARGIGENDLDSIIRNLTYVIPASVKPRHCPSDEALDLVHEAFRDGDYVGLALKSGIVLRSFPSRQQYRNYYYCFRDLVPSWVTPENYQSVFDLDRRLLWGGRSIKRLQALGWLSKTRPLNLIEGGAYIGWKAIGWMTAAPAGSNVIAVEMDSKQFDLLKINLDANKNLGEFSAIHAGLWNQSGEHEYSYEHPASHTLATPDEHSHHTQVGLVRTITLDEIIENSGITSFDHVNLQTGGAEYETLRGFRATHERVATLWVGSHYRHAGVSERFRCQTLLREYGFDLYDDFGPTNAIPRDAPIDKAKTGGFLACNPSKVNPAVPER